MDGKTLRLRVDNFTDTIGDVEEFLKQKNKLSSKAIEVINKIRDGLGDLFYIIPLEGEWEGEWEGE